MHLQMNQEAACPSYNPEIHGGYWELNFQIHPNQSILHRRNCNGLVVAWVMMYKWGKTVPESQTTPTPSNNHSGSAGRKHQGAHLSAEIRSWRLVHEHTLEEITSRVHKFLKCTWRRVNSAPGDEMTCEFRKWRCVYPAKWQQAQQVNSGQHTRSKTGEWNQQLEIGAPSTCQMPSLPRSAPTSRINSATAHAPDGWWVEGQVGVINADWVQLYISKQFWMRPKIISSPTKRFTEGHCVSITEAHWERQSPNGIMWDRWVNYREMMTDLSNQDHGQMSPNWNWIRGFSGSL